MPLGYDKIYLDSNTNLMTTHFANETLYALLRESNFTKYKVDTVSNEAYQYKIRADLDSMIQKFTDEKLESYHFRGRFTLKGDANYVLIPYLIWTMTSKYYHKEECGYDGHIITKCSWTRAQTWFIMVNIKSNEVVYFNYHGWRRREVWQPFEARVRRSFSRCLMPLLRRLNK